MILWRSAWVFVCVWVVCACWGEFNQNQPTYEHRTAGISSVLYHTKTLHYLLTLTQAHHHHPTPHSTPTFSEYLYLYIILTSTISLCARFRIGSFSVRDWFFVSVVFFSFVSFNATIAADANTNGEATTCGRILIVLSWVLVLCTMPLSLFVCFKVCVHKIHKAYTAYTFRELTLTLCICVQTTGGARVRTCRYFPIGPTNDRRRQGTR